VAAEEVAVGEEEEDVAAAAEVVEVSKYPPHPKIG
jgi:hypothetical protein